MKYCDIDHKKNDAYAWFRKLRDKICAEFQLIEEEEDNNGDKRFQSRSWLRGNDDDDGGGETRILRGSIFEKVGINVSQVYGKFDENIAKLIPGTENNNEFWASGISVVSHPQSPMIPAVHMNTRLMCTEKHWFGGGADLTPIYPNTMDEKDFHSAFESACNKYDLICYEKFKNKCDDYFYLPHRKEARGVGGIFYDNVNSGNWESDFSFCKSVGNAFLDVYPKIVRRNIDIKYDESHRAEQLRKRGRYVEFNLLHDRGTKFGFMTGGDVDAIMMSMPPMVTW